MNELPAETASPKTDLNASTGSTTTGLENSTDSKPSTEDNFPQKHEIPKTNQEFENSSSPTN